MTFDFGFSEGYLQRIEYGVTEKDLQPFDVMFRHIADDVELKRISERRSSLVKDADQKVSHLKDQLRELRARLLSAEEDGREKISEEIFSLSERVEAERDANVLRVLREIFDDVVIDIKMPERTDFDYSNDEHREALHHLPLFDACVLDAFEHSWQDMRKKNLKRLRGQ